mmetsp:Transcript_18734/g.38496  ORF Transcript_18734/g.38496 Transcript_18734/m.38496 type:complete len:121 (-) Transcript_18734:1305-1667(-)
MLAFFCCISFFLPRDTTTMAIRDRALFLLLSPPSLAAAHLTGELTPHEPFFRIRTRLRALQIQLTKIPTSLSRERQSRKESKRYEHSHVFQKSIHSSNFSCCDFHHHRISGVQMLPTGLC